jgi:hypothetical protein
MAAVSDTLGLLDAPFWKIEIIPNIAVSIYRREDHLLQSLALNTNRRQIY